jgi:hypothetical protein
MSKQWYAAYRPYGVTRLDTNGPRADDLLRFDTKGERDAWVAGDIRHRQGVAASAPELRAALRFEERARFAVIRTPDDWRHRHSAPAVRAGHTSTCSRSPVTQGRESTALAEYARGNPRGVARLARRIAPRASGTRREAGAGASRGAERAAAAGRGDAARGQSFPAGRRPVAPPARAGPVLRTARASARGRCRRAPSFAIARRGIRATRSRPCPPGEEARGQIARHPAAGPVVRARRLGRPRPTLAMRRLGGEGRGAQGHPRRAAEAAPPRQRPDGGVVPAADGSRAGDPPRDGSARAGGPVPARVSVVASAAHRFDHRNRPGRPAAGAARPPPAAETRGQQPVPRARRGSWRRDAGLGAVSSRHRFRSGVEFPRRGAPAGGGRALRSPGGVDRRLPGRNSAAIRRVVKSKERSRPPSSSPARCAGPSRAGGPTWTASSRPSRSTTSSSGLSRWPACSARWSPALWRANPMRAGRRHRPRARRTPRG